MKPNEIIYYNEYSGCTEPCGPSDVKNNQNITTKEGSYISSKIAKKLLMDGAVGFAIYEPNINMLDFLLGKPKMSQGDKKYEAIFTVEGKTDSSITVRLDENNFIDKPKFVGRIQFRKEKNVEVNGVKGNAIIRIFDVQMLTGTKETNSLLGQFSLSIGLYLFVDLDGKWETLDNSGSLIDVTHNEYVKQIKDELQNVHRDLRDGQKEITRRQEDIAMGINKRLDSIGDDIDQIKNSISSLTTSVAVYKEDLNERLEQIFDEDDRDSVINVFAKNLPLDFHSGMNGRSSASNPRISLFPLKYFLIRFLW